MSCSGTPAWGRSPKQPTTAGSWAGAPTPSAPSNSSPPGRVQRECRRALTTLGLVGLKNLPPLCDLTAPSWSGKQLRRLGEALRDGEPVPDSGPSYGDVMAYYDDLAAAVLHLIRELDWSSLLVDRPPPEITARAKTLTTLAEKLRRDPATPLPSVQDIAGVRFESAMTLEEQTIVAHAIASAFELDPATACHDLRQSHHSGYRAVHVWLRLPQGRVEVQVRTRLQGRWANLYEAMADLLGREIRYGEVPAEPVARQAVEAVQGISVNEIARLELLRQSLADQRNARTDAMGRTLGPVDPSLARAEHDVAELERQVVEQLEAAYRALAVHRH